MRGSCLPRYPAIRVGPGHPDQNPIARLAIMTKRDVQGPPASNERLINPKLDKPA